MFINRRVRCKDFLRILNKRREEKGKAPLKSTTAVWNRSKPMWLGTVQSSKHSGKGVWSCNKTAKSWRSGQWKQPPPKIAHKEHETLFLPLKCTRGCKKSCYILSKVEMTMRFCAQEHQLASKDPEHKGYNSSGSRKATSIAKLWLSRGQNVLCPGGPQDVHYEDVRWGRKTGY